MVEILDIDSHCPYLLSGEITFHLGALFNISIIHKKFKQYPINIKIYATHPHDMVHVPAHSMTWCTYQHTPMTWCTYLHTPMTWCTYLHTPMTWCTLPAHSHDMVHIPAHSHDMVHIPTHSHDMVHIPAHSHDMVHIPTLP